MTPDPLTIASIELQGIEWGNDAVKRYRCGCELRHLPASSVWYLCDHHQGYADGVEAARRELSAAAVEHARGELRAGLARTIIANRTDKENNGD